MFNQTIFLKSLLLSHKFANNHKNIMKLLRCVYHVQRCDLQLQAMREVYTLILIIVRYLHQFDKFGVLTILELNLKNHLESLFMRRLGLLHSG
jgi:hypothetical protein